MSKHLDGISKFLSYVLRHEPQAIGITLDREGWVDIDTLVLAANQSGQMLTRELIEQVVNTSDKKRFSISEDAQCIRAAQGHSTPTVSIQHVEKQPPECLYHGTATRFLESILRQGLTAQARQHVHLSESSQTALSVGQRYGQPVLLKIQAQRMYQQGFQFFQADNGVWLTAHVPVDFLALES